MNSDAQLGEAPSPEMIKWRSAASQLTPEKSLERIATNARFLTATVATLGTALTAFGLIGASAILEQRAPRILAVVAIVAVILSTAVAVSCLVLHARSVNLENLEAVKAWYVRELRKAHLLSIAGFLLLVSLIAGSAAGLTAALAPERRGGVSLEIYGAGAKRDVRISAEASGAPTGSVVEVTVHTDSAGTESLVYRGARRVSSAQTIRVSAVIKGVEGPEQVSAELFVDGILLSETSASMR